MSLPIGTVFGSYEIVGLLGAGGMGEVYRARDRKLHRDVAVKVLAAEFATDPDRLSRLQREARLLAALNHPRIGAIYGLEEVEGVPALILELVEGTTLAERVATGALPVREALSLARQIAEALEAAHDSGVVHRDLKPANIKITPQNEVKVLDFGIAKSLPGDPGPGSRTDATTVAVHETRDGAVLGTTAYMSPEQARGLAVDKRTDIWAFGCVLYEMLTGQRPFVGGTAPDIVVAILEREPSWSALPSHTPAGVRRLLERCLEKDPRQRLRDIGDARIELDEMLAASSQRPDRASLKNARGQTLDSSATTAMGRGWKIAAVTTALIAIAAIALLWRATRPESRSTIRLDVDLGQDAADPAPGASAIASPDGTRVVYRSRGPKGVVQLFTRSLNQDQPVAIAGTEDAVSPFFSPDGQWVGFFANRKLKKVSLRGGTAVDLADAPASRGGSWGDEGQIIAALTIGPLSRIPANGGSPQVLTELKGAATHRWPQVVPGAQAVVFTAAEIVGDFEHATIEIQSLTSGQRTTLVRDGYYGRYASSGHLVYISGGTLYAAPFDARRQTLTGSAVPVLDHVRSRVQGGGAALDLSANGTLIFAPGDPPTQRLAWLENTGRTEPIAAPPARYDYGLRVSPDGKKIAVSMAVAAFDIWAYDLERDAASRLTFTPLNDMLPMWAPDGQHIAYQCSQPGEPARFVRICWIRADGSGSSVVLTTITGAFSQPTSISADGRRLAFAQSTAETKGDLWTLPIEGADTDRPKAGEPTVFLRTPFNERWPAISPDGAWLAYMSDESGIEEVYVQPVPVGGQKSRVSLAGGRAPLWSKKGRELFYQSREGIMAVSYTTANRSFVPGKPRLWAAKPDLHEWFDQSPDGKRFAIIEDTTPNQRSVPVTFLFNFFDELGRRVAASGQ